VSRRPDPNASTRLDARRCATSSIDENRMPATVADAWVREWEAEAGRLGIDSISESWTIGLAWIHEQTEQDRRGP
jgi:hypothetical protein